MDEIEIRKVCWEARLRNKEQKWVLVFLGVSVDLAAAGLVEPGTSLRELASRTHIKVDKARRVLGELIDLGLVAAEIPALPDERFAFSLDPIKIAALTPSARQSVMAPAVVAGARTADQLLNLAVDDRMVSSEAFGALAYVAHIHPSDAVAAVSRRFGFSAEKSARLLGQLIEAGYLAKDGDRYWPNYAGAKEPK